MNNNHTFHTSAEHLQIGDRIKLRIQDVNSSRYDLARYCNVTLRTVYNWCENKSVPELKVISLLCFRLQSNIPWLITGKVEKHQWNDVFPDDFFDFLNVIKEVQPQRRGDVLRSVFNMVMSLHTQINHGYIINARDISRHVNYLPVYQHQMQEHLSFCQRFKLQKSQLKISNQTIAIACNVSVKTVYNWSIGRYQPSIELLPTLCKVLRVNLPWLITGICDITQWLNIGEVELKEMLYQLNQLPARVTSQILKLVSIMVKEIQCTVK
ncbi:helix-turn-helix transcriptional regulator [Moritella marina ATCC 15381]|uniref:Helix-turn-helix transcriptional regulator n=1 Tax=Moritella marina ATCC 15381 TaxID=1202962 RepID=A0A5J6WGB3_MORMI|nr:helix-turn-helix transcriptional regulator [Moritella marina]QFI36524.1 helix-turn-helix transcriptional regulator [Moritella marina ATCC 15381]